jgi:hypothetical protein
LSDLIFLWTYSPPLQLETVRFYIYYLSCLSAFNPLCPKSFWLWRLKNHSELVSSALSWRHIEMHYFGIPVVYRFNHSYDVLCSSLPLTIHKGVTLYDTKSTEMLTFLLCVYNDSFITKSRIFSEYFHILFLNVIETVHLSYRFRTKKWTWFFVTVYIYLLFGPLPHLVLHVVLIGHTQCCNAFQCLKQ